MQALAEELEDLDPDQLLRARRPASLQQPRDDRSRRRDRSASIARATFPTARATRRNSISAPATPASRSGTGRHRRRSASASAGTNGIPETARAMVLMGAEILFYPTAIGSEPHDPDLDTSRLWRRAMIGHACRNCRPGDRRQPHRHGEWRAASASTATASSATNAATSLAEFGAEETGVLVADARPRRGQETPRRHLASSGIAGRSFMGGWWRTANRAGTRNGRTADWSFRTADKGCRSRRRMVRTGFRGRCSFP